MRIGVALSDTQHMIASPLTTIAAKPIRSAIAAIRELIQKHNVDLLVVGLPLDLDGRKGKAARRTERFITRLSKTLPEMPIEWWDERMSSVAAERVLLDGNVRRSTRKKKIDMIAASWILQGYLAAFAEKE